MSDDQIRIFSVNSSPHPSTDLTPLLLPPPPSHTHTIMDMRNNKRRNVLTHARVNFSQSETSSLLRGAGGTRELNFELLLWWGINRNDPQFCDLMTFDIKNCQTIGIYFTLSCNFTAI